jgi:hypothetical protein
VPSVRQDQIIRHLGVAADEDGPHIVDGPMRTRRYDRITPGHGAHGNAGIAVGIRWRAGMGNIDKMVMTAPQNTAPSMPAVNDATERPRTTIRSLSVARDTSANFAKSTFSHIADQHVPPARAAYPMRRRRVPKLLNDGQQQFWPMLSARAAMKRLTTTAALDSQSVIFSGSIPARSRRSLTMGSCWSAGERALHQSPARHALKSGGLTRQRADEDEGRITMSGSNRTVPSAGSRKRCSSRSVGIEEARQQRGPEDGLQEVLHHPDEGDRSRQQHDEKEAVLERQRTQHSGHFLLANDANDANGHSSAESCTSPSIRYATCVACPATTTQPTNSALTQAPV